MTYEKLRLATGCLFPLLAFTVFFVSSATLMLSTHVHGLILFAGSIGMGICGALLISGLATPLNNLILTRELKQGGTCQRLAAWINKDPVQETYIGPNGVWHNGEKYYWGHSVVISLEDVSLKNTREGFILVIRLGEDLGRSIHYFDLDIPVPQGSEKEAEKVVCGILAAHILLDKNGKRKEDAGHT